MRTNFSILTSLCLTVSACRVGQPGLFEPCEPSTITESTAVTGSPVLENLTAKNVLMISMDTLRRDRIGRYSCERLSPFLDDLLESSVVLDNHHSCSAWTLPSATCVLTGQSAIDLGSFPQIKSGNEIPKLETETQSLATELAQAGFATALVSSNLYISSKSGLDVGYETVITKRKPAKTVLGTLLTELDAIEASDPTTPWFGHAHLIDPHTPYSPPVEYLTKIQELPEIQWDLSSTDGTRQMNEAWETLGSSERDDIGQHLVYRYGAEIRYMNDQLESFFGELESRGWLENTLVVLWSDHGEQFWEHGDWGHGISLHGGENRAIAAFRGPGVDPVAWTYPTTHVDLAPTILNALGIGIPEAWTGSPLGLHDHSRPIFAATAPKEADIQQSVLHENRRLLYRWDGDKKLYDIAVDPNETNNLYNANSDSVQELWGYLEEEVNRLVALFPDKPAPVAIGP